MQRAHHAVIAALAVAALGVPATAVAQRQTENVDRTVALPSNGTLELHNFSGRVRIRAGGGNDVVIKAVRRAERPQLQGITLEVTTSGSTVKVDANHRSAEWEDRDNNVVETEFDIQVPASAKLVVNAFSSDVDVDGITGDQRLKTFSGDITVIGARGAMRVESFNGDVDVDLSAAGGSPELAAKTFSGDIEARLAADASGSVEFDTFSGEMDSALPLTLRTSSRKRTRADLPGGSGRTLDFQTFSGDVRIRR